MEQLFPNYYTAYFGLSTYFKNGCENKVGHAVGLSSPLLPEHSSNITFSTTPFLNMGGARKLPATETMDQPPFPTMERYQTQKICVNIWLVSSFKLINALKISLIKYFLDYNELMLKFNHLTYPW